MGAGFVPSGVELIAKNLGGFLSDLNTANKAIENLGNRSSISSSIIPGFQGLGNAILDVGAKAAAVAAGGIAALGASLTAVAVKGTVMAADLEQGMANIAATSGKTVDEVAPLKGLIEDLALDPNLKVTTDEATQAVQALTKQGLDMTQILEGAGKATVALSNATGGEFGVSASLTAGVMKAFNIEAKDLTQVIDGITGVTTNSKFTVDDYALAFAQAGAVAANLGVDLNDFNAVIGATASSFSSGSDAGTSFKTLLLKLSAPTAEMKAVMQEYGISLFDAEGKMRSMKDIVNQLNTVLQGNATITEMVGGATKKEVAEADRAREAIPDLTQKIKSQAEKLDILKGELALTTQYYGEGSPKTRKMALAVQDLEYSFSQNQQTLQEYNTLIAKVDGNQAKQITTTKKLTEAERAKIAEALGGADASRLILALSKTSAEQFDELSGKINANGLAFKSASTRMNTAKGALEILQGIIEAIQIQIGQQFLPLVTKIAIAMSNWANDIGPQVVGFFGQIAEAINYTIAVGTRLFAAFQAGGLALFSTFFGVEGIYLWAQIKILITNVSTAVSGLGEAIGSILPDFSQLSTGGVVSGVTQAIAFLNENFTAFAGAIGGVVAAGVIGTVVALLSTLASPVLLVAGAAALLGAAWATNFGGIQDKTYAVWATVQPVLIAIGTWLATNIPLAIQAASAAWSDYLLPAITTVATFMSTYIIPALMQLGVWLGQLLIADINGFSAAFTVAFEYMSGVWDTVYAAGAAFADFVSTNLTPLMMALNNFISAVFNKSLQLLAGIWKNFLLPAITSVGNFILSVLQPSFESTGKTVEEKVMPPFNEFTDVILPALNKGLDALKDIIKQVTDFFNSLASAVNSFSIPEVLQRHSPSPFEQSLIAVGAEANNAAASIASMGQAGNITAEQLDKLLGVQRGIASTNNVIGAAADYVEKYFDKIAQTSGSKTKFALRVLKDVFKQNSKAILSASDREAAFGQLANSAVNFEKAGVSGGAISGAISRFLKFYDSERERLEKLQQTIFVQAGRKAVTLGNNLNDIIKSSSDVLDARVNTLQALLSTNQAQVEFEGHVISATEAQQRLNEALKEQQQVQEQLIIAQQNQAKLDFLDKQLNLLETINKAGLNAKNILGGLQLGLNASIPDIITATNRLVQAMVDQIDKDLQIHSPSKVLAARGQYAGMGMAKGIMQAFPAVTEAFQRLVAPLASYSPASPLGNGAYSNVTNYNFGMNVSTGASATSVIQQYSVMQAMVG